MQGEIIYTWSPIPKVTMRIRQLGTRRFVVDKTLDAGKRLVPDNKGRIVPVRAEMQKTLTITTSKAEAEEFVAMRMLTMEGPRAAKIKAARGK